MLTKCILASGSDKDFQRTDDCKSKENERLDCLDILQILRTNIKRNGWYLVKRICILSFKLKVLIIHPIAVFPRGWGSIKYLHRWVN